MLPIGIENSPPFHLAHISPRGPKVHPPDRGRARRGVRQETQARATGLPRWSVRHHADELQEGAVQHVCVDRHVSRSTSNVEEIVVKVKLALVIKVLPVLLHEWPDVPGGAPG